MGGVCNRLFGRHYGLQIFFFPWALVILNSANTT
jgi:hypothetical protein